MITQAELQQIIATMGPIMKLHPNERYMPDDADAFLQDSPPHCKLRWGRVPNDGSYNDFEVEGRLLRVAVGSDGTIWGVDKTQSIYRRDGQSLTLVPGSLVQIAVGSATQVWGIDASDLIYRRDGNSWTNIAGHLTSIGVGSDGTVWGVDRAGAVYRRDGNAWTTIPGTLMQISVGSASQVWGVNKDGLIFRRDGNSWTNIPGNLVNVSVAADGTVYGVGRDCHLYRRDANQWTQLPGTFFQVSVGSATQVWGCGLSNRDYLSVSSGDVPSNLYNITRSYGSAVVSSGVSLMNAVDVAKQDPNHGDPAFHYWLELAPGSIYGAPERAKAYVTVSHFNREVVRIAFWFYYPFNGPGKFRITIGDSTLDNVEIPNLGRHYSDWEHVTLAVHKTSQGWKLDAVYLSRHDLTIWHSPADLQFSGQHPIIYVARDSHAHYATAGTQYYKRPFSQSFGVGTAAIDLYDLTADSGYTLDTSQPGRCVVVEAQADLPGLVVTPPAWLGYDGRWGQYEPLSFTYSLVDATGVKLYDYVQTDVGAGPAGPAQHDKDDFWRTIVGSLKSVSVGSDGTVWGVDANNLIYRREGDYWTNIPGHLVQISVGNANQVWGVDADDLIYRRDGNSWTNIPGHLINVSVGDDGTVWGVNRDGLIYRRDGNAWTNIPGYLAMISVGNSSNVWGTDRDRNIYRWSGSSWVQIPGALNTLSVASDGTVWGAARVAGSLFPVVCQVYRRDGNSWTLIDGSLTQLSVGCKDLIWGVDSLGRIFNRS